MTGEVSRSDKERGASMEGTVLTDCAMASMMGELCIPGGTESQGARPSGEKDSR